MIGWHTHKFVEHYRVFSGRLNELQGLKCSEYMAERMMFGVTTIVARCEVCGKAETIEVFGDATKQKTVQQ